MKYAVASLSWTNPDALYLTLGLAFKDYLQVNQRQASSNMEQPPASNNVPEYSELLAEKLDRTAQRKLRTLCHQAVRAGGHKKRIRPVTVRKPRMISSTATNRNCLAYSSTGTSIPIFR